MWCTLQPKNCVIHTCALQRRASHNGALYKSSFLFLSFLNTRQGVTDGESGDCEKDELGWVKREEYERD